MIQHHLVVASVATWRRYLLAKNAFTAMKPPRVRRIGSPRLAKSAMSPNKPIGVNKIRLVMKEAITRLGYPDCTGHGLRSCQALNSSRHKLVSAQLPYIECDGHPECAKLRALGVMPGESKLKAAENPTTKKIAAAKKMAVTNPFTKHPRKVGNFVTKPYEKRGWGKSGWVLVVNFKYYCRI